ncbi:MAG: 30S ribosomal protein S9 [Bdellovibrionales bacterium RIFOXYD12_FULL_39_22]|nr:MAG: 30S ribosomal protein S9 [Bdellovibrionales bacterium RIFOXYB1_FULL_39_21]OFZ45151.1 MAG: 30S ribosomal protein S9 [Bdellovibrionales bacterium RIFOXYC12_FULL_39_17]OFZ45657.1 MAG: 30S ribosomal protein S9 [Bdellovibrionales bacterium RIFOXYC1_FULL_39_130]OFZ77519.1 MAG: 30S ribosomal protein S9 [Bdellovibrionales bacterium RIFOXYD1_FULL_39_84]OFZ91648.1 MAG: 30S ribosomal protein S9 [Bdellovibrionales bacterium RIFOXYD12_FULL_39_22]HLE11888.1 30S ribosomal protein S9 [Bacteriovoracace
MAVKGKVYKAHAVGRRKCAVARVYMSEGSGKITINRRPVDNYFEKGTSQYVVNQPLTLLNASGNYDILVNVRGGGTTGQAGAVRLGISRALLKIDPTLRPALKKAGFLSRDARKVERKKCGMSGARKRYQFSKR